MAKRKPLVRMRTHGIYSKWESESKRFPRFLHATTEIPARVDLEFGLVVNIKHAKNRELIFCIDHPGILDDAGKRRPPFDGTVYVKTNDWDFFLGDTIWEPIADKIGTWRLTLEMDGQVIAEKTFQLVRPEEEDDSLG